MNCPSRPIYMDYLATTPVDPRVVEVTSRTMRDEFGNPNSADSWYGRRAAAILDTARCHVAQLVGSHSRCVHFLSGATAAITIALQHAVMALSPAQPLCVALSPIEHHAVLDAVSKHADAGHIRVRWLNVSSTGQPDLDDVRSALANNVRLVIAMAANNEIGTISPVEDICRLVSEANASILVDATQAVGKVHLAVDAWDIDYLVLSGHKMYGPKGIGAIALGQNVVRPQLMQMLMPAGTPNVHGIAGLGEASRLRLAEMKDDEPRIAALRDRLEERLCEAIPDVVINGDRACRLAGSLHIAVPGILADAVLARLHECLTLSTRAACRTGTQEPSHVLRGIGLREDLQECALRFGLGKFTTDSEVVSGAALLLDAMSAVRAASATRS